MTLKNNNKNDININNNINKMKSKLIFDSIILNKNHYNNIYNGLHRLYPNDKYIKSNDFKIIFRASCDGDKFNTVFELAKYSNNILLIIETNKGKIFGIYSDIRGGFIFDENVIKYNRERIKFHKSKNKIIVGNFLYLSNSFLNYKNKILKDYLIIGEHSFVCKEVEIFQYKS